MMQLHNARRTSWRARTMACVGIFMFAPFMVGCGDGDKTGSCRTDDDCPGGACVVGMCRPLTGADLSGAVMDMSVGGDLSTPVPDGWNPDALTATCSFNSDGTVDRAEEPFVVG